MERQRQRDGDRAREISRELERQTRERCGEIERQRNG
jgi:hypothetical protein